MLRMTHDTVLVELYLNPQLLPEVAPVKNLDTRRAAYLLSFVGNTERMAYNTFAIINTTEVTNPIILTPRSLFDSQPRMGEKITCPIGFKATTQLYLFNTVDSSSPGRICNSTKNFVNT